MLNRMANGLDINTLEVPFDRGKQKLVTSPFSRAQWICG